YCSVAHPPLHSFPTRRSSDLQSAGLFLEAGRHLLPAAAGALAEGTSAAEAHAQAQAQPAAQARPPWLLFDVYAEFRALVRMYLEDRKSTRLNSSHDQISYAVF